MIVIRNISFMLGRNLLGFLAIVLFIVLIAFLPTSFIVHANQLVQDQWVFRWDYYWHGITSYLADLIRGDLGSISPQFGWFNTEVQIIAWVEKLALRSIFLLFPALLLGAVTGILFGSSTFFLPKWAKRLLGMANQLFFSIPDLLLMIIIQIVAVKVDIWYGEPLVNIAELVDHPAILLPILCMAIPVGAYLYRYTINSCNEVLNQEFIRTAKAKGLPNRIIFFKHVMRPAADTLLAVMPKIVAFAASSLVIVERLFNILGVTWYFNGAPMRIGNPSTLYATLLICLAAFIMILNIMTSLLRLWVNPSLRR